MIKFFSLSLLLLVFTGCNNNSGQVDTLTQENLELSTKYQNQLEETRIATRLADSLQTVVNAQQSQLNKLKGEPSAYKATTQDEMEIERLVGQLHQGWSDMLDNDDPNEILQYFLPKYTTSALRINNANIPSVKRSNDSDFEEHLNDLIKANNVKISFGQTKFLYTEVKDNFFVTSYQTRYRVYLDNEQVESNSLTTQLAGEYKDGWKVGSYNWVTFNY